MRRRFWIIGSIIAFVILMGGLYANFEFDRIDHIKKATTAYELSAVKVLKADLNLYYALYGNYPTDKDKFLEKLSENEFIKKNEGKPFDTNSLQKVMNSLKDFSYTVRGDEQAYKFSYIDQYGEKKVIEGNYQKDFH
jgi:hypothetical protein